ncbi:MAG: hypothetical protein KGM98_06645 [Bacteroidota bacterium]|nr:hypothetical protein [Bacteroidota bacterium]
MARTELDHVKWDLCIDRAANGAIYAYTDYLDRMSAHWDGLVLNEYEMVMPLTWNRKYFIYYLYQPFFCAQLGIFGNGITAHITEAFLKKIPSRYRYWDIYLNRDNFFEVEGFEMYKRSNYILPLQPSYPELYDRYAQSHRRNIRRALDSGNEVRRNPDFREVIGLARAQALRYSPIRAEDYRNFEWLLEKLKGRSLTEANGVYDRRGLLMASAVWIFSHQMVCC